MSPESFTITCDGQTVVIESNGRGSFTANSSARSSAATTGPTAWTHVCCKPDLRDSITDAFVDATVADSAGDHAGHGLSDHAPVIGLFALERGGALGSRRLRFTRPGGLRCAT